MEYQYILSFLRDFLEECQQPIFLDQGLQHNFKDTIKQINFYTNSQYLDGRYDELRRFKPFFNIVTALRITARAAVDIDTKDMDVSTNDNSERVRAFLMKKELQSKMNEMRFGQTLNDIVDISTTYGGNLVKRMKKNGKTYITTPLWANMYVDPRNIKDGPKVEKFDFKVRDIIDYVDVWNNFKNIDQLKASGEVRLSDPVEIYELYGTIRQNGTGKYTPQKAIVSDMNGYRVVLHHEEGVESPYKYHNYDKVWGRGLGRGEVEVGFESQIWSNDAILKYRRAMELGSKVIFQTADKVAASNILYLDDGHILKHQGGGLQAMNLVSNAIPKYSELLDLWKGQVQGASATYDAQRGETPKSGQPYSLQQLVVNQSSSTFDVKRENLSFHIEDIVRDWMLDDVMKDLNKAHKYSDKFTLDELQLIDEWYRTSNANEEAKKMLLKGKYVSPESYDAIMSDFHQEILADKDKRFFEFTEGTYKGFDPNIFISFSNEQQNKAAVLTSLSTIFQQVLGNPAVLRDPVARKIFMEIVETAGFPISPNDLTTYAQQTTGPIQGQPSPIGGAQGVPQTSELTANSTGSPQQ